ncbi:MAG: glycosyltransferase [Hymenobacter sp.]|nr:MAG: glycosyltransferase [Hymenobacter sp.]
MLARSIAKAAQQLEFTNYYVVQDGIMFHALTLPDQLPALKYLYYLRDFTITVPYFRRHGPWVEDALIRRADAVLTNTPYINDYIWQHQPKHSTIIGQGCVLSLYQAGASYSRPADLAGLAGPLIGYTGLLTTLRLDINLLLSIARQRPEWQLVLIGPEDDDFKKSALHKMPNVHFLGRKPPEELPAYLSYMDACINPQTINELTIGNYPLKIDEYLAMGKPTVATLTPGMDLFQDYVYLADGEQQWLEMLAQALREQDPTQIVARIHFAQGHTWAACAQLVYETITTIEKETSAEEQEVSARPTLA